MANIRIYRKKQKMAMEVGRHFSSFEEFEQAVHSYGAENFTVFVKGDCKKVRNQDEYDHVTFVCKQGGRLRVSQSKGLRSQKKSLKCKCKVRANGNADGSLTLTKVVLQHNHDVSEALYGALLESRKTQMVGQSSKPQTNRSSSKPQIDCSSSKPQIDCSSSKPQTNRSSSKPQINRSSSKPQINCSSSKPQIADQSSKPQMAGPSWEPQTPDPSVVYQEEALLPEMRASELLFKELEGSFSKMKQSYSGMESELMLRDDTTVSLKRKNAALYSEIGELRSLDADKHAEINRLKRSVADKNAEIGRLRVELKEKNSKIEELKGADRSNCGRRDLATLDVTNLEPDSSSSACGTTSSGPHPSSSTTTPITRPAPKESADSRTRPVRKSSFRPIGTMIRNVSPNKEREKMIQQKSVFRALMNSPLHVPMGPTHTKMMEYDEVYDNSPYMDCSTGTYGVPIRAKYVFKAQDGGVVDGGEVEWFVCGWDGKREKMTGRRRGDGGGYVYDRVEWECEKGEDVWVEGVGVGQDVKVKWFFFEGRMSSD